MLDLFICRRCDAGDKPLLPDAGSESGSTHTKKCLMVRCNSDWPVRKTPTRPEAKISALQTGATAMQAGITGIQTRIDAIEANQAQINERLEKVEKQMTSIEALLRILVEKDRS
jgi:hypothetical protein